MTSCTCCTKTVSQAIRTITHAALIDIYSYIYGKLLLVLRKEHDSCLLCYKNIIHWRVTYPVIKLVNAIKQYYHHTGLSILFLFWSLALSLELKKIGNWSEWAQSKEGQHARCWCNRYPRNTATFITSSEIQCIYLLKCWYTVFIHQMQLCWSW